LPAGVPVDSGKSANGLTQKNACDLGGTQRVASYHFVIAAWREKDAGLPRCGEGW